MSESIVFDPVLPVSWSAAITLLLTLFFIWLEIKKPFRWKALRLACLVAMMTSLLVILLKPSTFSAFGDDIILLTKGYEKEKADSIIKLHDGISIYREHSASPYPNAVTLASYNQIGDLGRKIRFVVGEGIPEYALELLDSPSFILISQTPSLIENIFLPKNIVQNHAAEIIFSFRDSLISKIVLSGPGGKEDSISLEKQQTNIHRLRLTPKIAGNFLYDVMIHKNGKLHKEKLPVSVQPERALNILFIQRYPTFESRYIKHYLSRDHKLMVRYQVSKNTYRYESINRAPAKIRALNKNLLNQFDLVLIDSDEHQSLSPIEKNALQQSIYGGLGVIVLLNENPFGKRSLANFLPGLEKTGRDTAHLVMNDKKIILPVWPLEISDSKNIYPLLKAGNKVISAYKYSGFGKIGVSLLQETYGTYLRGDSITYSQIWSRITGKIARSASKPYDLVFNNKLPCYVDEPLHFTITGTDPNVYYNGQPIPLSEDFHIDDHWHGRFWPDKTGWNQLLIANDSSSASFYVSEENEWNSVRSATITSANNTVSSRANPSPAKSWKPVSLVPFYILFTICSALLWVSPKL